MLLTYTYVFLAFFFRRLFDSLVIDPDPPAKKTHQEETDALREEVKQVLGDVGLTGFIRKLVVSINLISDIMIVVGILLFKFFPSFGIGCIVAGCLVWITIINARFDLSPKEISYSNEEIADPTGIEFKDPKPIEPAVASCAVCGELLVGQIVMCKRCETPHHKDCWKYLGKCSVYGCGGRYSRNQTRKEIIDARKNASQT